MEKITPQSTSGNQENLKFSNDILKCFENENIKTEYDALINNSQGELDDLFDDTEPLKESFLHRYKVRLEQLHIGINNFETTKNSNMKEQLIYEIIKKSSKLEQWSSCSAIQNEVSEIYESFLLKSYKHFLDNPEVGRIITESIKTSAQQLRQKPSLSLWNDTESNLAILKKIIDSKDPLRFLHEEDFSGSLGIPSEEEVYDKVQLLLKDKNLLTNAILNDFNKALYKHNEHSISGASNEMLRLINLSEEKGLDHTFIQNLRKEYNAKK